MLVLMLGPHSFVARSGPQHARAGPHTQCEEAHRMRQVREGAPVSISGAGSVASKPQSMARASVQFSSVQFSSVSSARAVMCLSEF